tara:strand:+ start:5337 stop:7850 length:2514 start_codon:yes stop_codon:yes gene_type:complete
MGGMSVLDVLGGQIGEGVLAPPQRIGEPTPTRNVLGINHPLAESHLLPRSIVAMLPLGGATSGFTQEAIATLGQPEETVFSIPPSRYGTRDPRYFPLPDGADITSHDLARFELGLDALDAAPFVGALGGLASVAIPFLGRQPLLSGSSGGIPSPSAQRGAIGSDINARKVEPAVQVSSEALPSTGLIEGRMIKRMPIDIQDEYERQVQEIIGPSLYDKLGLTVVDEAIAPSKYDGHQGRSLQTMLMPETEVNEAGDLVLTPDYKKKLLELTAARGFIQDQDAVTMNFAVPLRSSEDVGVGYISYGRVITDDEMRFFDEMLDELGAKDDTIARVTTPKGIKFLNLGMDSEEFQDLMQSVHTKSGQKIDLFKNDLGEEMDYGYIGGSDWRGGQEAYQKIGAEMGDAGDGKRGQPWWSADDEFISLKERILEHRRQFIKDNPLPEKTIREIADESDAYYQREGLTLGLKDHSDEAMDVLASRMFDEALGVLRGGDRTGRGWYTSRYDQALGELAVKIPELDLETKTQKDLYTTLTGIFSDGTAIQPNTELAVNQYRDFLRTGKVNAMTPTAGGERNKSFRNNLDKLQDLIDDKGLEGAMEFLDGFSTTRDLQKLTNRKIGYLQDQRLPNSVIFGDKVGVFMANLKGHPDYLTMDRWWNRTVHRLRGHMGDEPSEKGLERFRALLGREKEAELMRKAGHGPQYTPAARRKTLTKEARRLSKQYQKKDYKDGTPLEVAANTIFKAETGLRDVAKSGGEKKFQLDLARKVAERFRQDTEYSDMTAADLQAIMWFAEKRRMKEFGSRDVRGSEELDFMDAVKRLPPNVLDPSLKNTPEPSPLSP